jgi:hypothetical protein
MTISSLTLILLSSVARGSVQHVFQHRSSACLMRLVAFIVRLLELMRSRKRADVAGLQRLVVHIYSANFDLHLPAAELQ